MLQTAIKLSVPKRCRVRRIDLRAHQGGLVRLFSLFWCASKWIKEIRHQSISAQLLEHDPIIWAFPNGYWTYRFVTPSRELLAIAICFAFSLSLIESRSNTSTDLTLLLSPADRLPLNHKITERFDPFVPSPLCETLSYRSTF